MFRISVTYVCYIQGGNRKGNRFGNEMYGQVVERVSRGESIHDAIRRHCFKLKRYTVDVSDRYDRYLIRLNNGDYGTPFIEQCHEVGLK